MFPTARKKKNKVCQPNAVLYLLLPSSTGKLKERKYRKGNEKCGRLISIPVLLKKAGGRVKQEDVGSKLNIFKEALSTMQNFCSRKQADSSFRQFGQDAYLYESFK